MWTNHNYPKNQLSIFLIAAAFILVFPSAAALEKTDYVKGMVSNTYYCKDDCRMVLEVCNPTLTTLDGMDYSVKDMKAEGVDASVESGIIWMDHAYDVCMPVYKSEIFQYFCGHELILKESIATCQETINDLNGTSETIIFQHGYEYVDKNIIYWHEDVQSGTKCVQKTEKIGQTDKLYDLKMIPDISTILPGKCTDVTLTGKMRYFNDAVDIIPSIAGFNFPEYAVWNSSLFNITATPNMTGVAVDYSDAIVLFSRYDTDTTNASCYLTHNESCWVNYRTSEMDASEDGSDLECYNDDTDQTCEWVTFDDNIYDSYIPDNACDLWDADDAGGGLISWWRFDEVAGTLAEDKCNRNNGTYVSSPDLTENGLWFFNTTFEGDKTADYVTMPNNANSLNITGNKLTMLAWFKTDYVAGTTHIVGMPVSGAAGSIKYRLLIDANKLQCVVNADSTVTNTIAFTDTASWHYLACSYDGARQKMYLDGILVDNDANTGNIDANTVGNFSVGRFSSSYTQFYDGLVDEVMIFNESLSQQRIKKLMRETGARVLNYSMSAANTSAIKFSTNGTISATSNDDVNSDLNGMWMFEPSITASGQLLDLSNNGKTATVSGAVFTQNSTCSHGDGRNSVNSLGCYYCDGSNDVIMFNIAFASVSLWYRNNSGGWHHLFKNGTTNTYEDGVLKSFGRFPIYISSPNSYLCKSASTVYVGGFVDDVRLFNVTRTLSQIQGLAGEPFHGTGPAWTYDLLGNTVTISDPVDDDYLDTTTPTFTFISTENGNCMLYLNGTAYDNNSSVSAGVTSYLTVNTSLSDGNYSAWITCVGLHTITSQNLSIVIDTTDPSLIIISPADGSFQPAGNITFTYNTSDANMDNCSLYVNNSFVMSNNSITQVNNQFIHAYTAELNYTWFIRCFDMANNSNTSATWWFAIDATPPNVTLTSPANNSILTSYTVDLEYNATDSPAGIDNCTLILDGAVNETNTSVTEVGNVFGVTFTAVGLHNWTVNCTDNVGNSYAPPVWWFNISCVMNATGLCDGCRYQDRNVSSLVMGCSGSVSSDACYISINNFLPESVNCSSFDLVLENGWNRVEMSVESSGVNATEEMDVWAKDMDPSWTDMLPAYVAGVAAAIVMAISLITGVALFAMLAGVLTLVLAYELVGFSMAAAVLCLLAGFGLMLKGVMR